MTPEAVDSRGMSYSTIQQFYKLATEYSAQVP